ncbi:MAG: hypothetical protein ACOCV2_15155 [Persicimonas sp.]
MRPLFLAWIPLAAVFLVLTTGCPTSVGDECGSDGDCTDDNNAVCDTTVDQGYCTIVDCRPGNCPADSVCVEFDRDTRYCMQICEDDSECREGHACRRDQNLEDEAFGYCYHPADDPDN